MMNENDRILLTQVENSNDTQQDGRETAPPYSLQAGDIEPEIRECNLVCYSC